MPTPISNAAAMRPAITLRTANKRFSAKTFLIRLWRLLTMPAASGYATCPQSSHAAGRAVAASVQILPCRFPERLRGENEQGHGAQARKPAAPCHEQGVAPLHLRRRDQQTVGPARVAIGVVGVGPLEHPAVRIDQGRNPGID